MKKLRHHRYIVMIDPRFLGVLLASFNILLLVPDCLQKILIFYYEVLYRISYS